MPTPCTVTGTLQTLTSGKIAQGQVIFQLTNIGTGNPLIISGTAIFPALTYNVQTAGDGTFTTQLWGNDNITPSNTLYSVTFRDSAGNEVGPILYSIVGASANLNTLAATSTVLPPVISPGGPYYFNGTSVMLTGNSSDQTVDSFTLTGGTLGTNKGIRWRIQFGHFSGSAAITYKFFYGVTSYTVGTVTNTGNVNAVLILELWANGATNVQILSNNPMIFGTTVAAASNVTSAAIDSTVNQTVKFTFNVAATDVVNLNYSYAEIV